MPKEQGAARPSPSPTPAPAPSANQQPSQNQDDADFEAFANDGAIEGSFDAVVTRGDPKPKPAPAAPQGADDGDDGQGDGDDGQGDDGQGDDGQGDGGEGAGDGEGDEAPRRQTASDRIRELNKRLRESERARLAQDARIDALEKGGLPKPNGEDNSGGIGEPPDVTDTAKYPLGHLDDRYLEDRTEWLATKKAAEIADRILQRQQDSASQAAATAAQTALLGKIDDLATRGEALEDFQELVVDAGLKGEWPLTQTTFEAAHEAEHGADILYALAKNPTEAKRVHDLSPLEQLRYVDKKNAEITAAKAGRRKPQAGAPPAVQPKGANSRTVIDPATDNLDDFEKAWLADEKGGRR